MGQFWQIFKTVKMHNTGEATPEKNTNKNDIYYKQWSFSLINKMYKYDQLSSFVFLA